MAKTFGKIKRVHNIVGLVFGLQLLFWTISGLFFTIFPIEQVRGSNLRTPINHGQLALGQVEVTASEAGLIFDSHAPIRSAQLDMLFGEPVWKLTTGKVTHLVSAGTGDMRSPISPKLAMRVATEGIKQTVGKPGLPRLMSEDPPREYAGPLPAYVVDYDQGSVRVYIDANTGRLVTVRTNLWRTFDVLWRFHIMDITGADRFDSWWLRVFAFFGLTMALSGAALVIRRLRRGLIFR